MTIELPAAQRVQTRVYDNLKGVDFTNDSTNVWHRRSPDAVNMLPDESGRPFKRTGWEVAVSAEELASALGLETLEILIPSARGCRARLRQPGGRHDALA